MILRFPQNRQNMDVYPLVNAEKALEPLQVKNRRRKAKAWDKAGLSLGESDEEGSEE